jgi:hypothetical protein
MASEVAAVERPEETEAADAQPHLLESASSSSLNIILFGLNPMMDTKKFQKVLMEHKIQYNKVTKARLSPTLLHTSLSSLSHCAYVFSLCVGVSTVSCQV